MFQITKITFAAIVCAAMPFSAACSNKAAENYHERVDRRTNKWDRRLDNWSANADARVERWNQRYKGWSDSADRRSKEQFRRIMGNTG